MLNNFNLKPERYEEMLLEQNGKCAICFKECPTGRNLAIDHNHKTNEVRGLLCQSCNLGIGKFYDDKALLDRAIQYLNRY